MPSLVPVWDSDQGAEIRPPTSSNAQTQEENDAAKLILKHLDKQWFCDNVVRWPSSRSGSPPGVINKDIASSFCLWEHTVVHTSPRRRPGFTKSRLSTAERALNPWKCRTAARKTSGGAMATAEGCTWTSPTAAPHRSFLV